MRPGATGTRAIPVETENLEILVNRERRVEQAHRVLLATKDPREMRAVTAQTDAPDQPDLTAGRETTVIPGTQVMTEKTEKTGERETREQRATQGVTGKMGKMGRTEKMEHREMREIPVRVTPSLLINYVF